MQEYARERKIWSEAIDRKNTIRPCEFGSIFSIDNGEEITCIPWQLVEGEGRPGIPRAFFSSDGNYISVGNEFSHVWRAFDLKMGGRIYDVNTFMCQEGKLWLVDGYPDQVIVPTSKV